MCSSALSRLGFRSVSAWGRPEIASDSPETGEAAGESRSPVERDSKHGSPTPMPPQGVPAAAPREWIPIVIMAAIFLAFGLAIWSDHGAGKLTGTLAPAPLILRELHPSISRVAEHKDGALEISLVQHWRASLQISEMTR
jgi:hypothetical protein